MLAAEKSNASLVSLLNTVLHNSDSVVCQVSFMAQCQGFSLAIPSQFCCKNKAEFLKFGQSTIEICRFFSTEWCETHHLCAVILIKSRPARLNFEEG